MYRVVHSFYTNIKLAKNQLNQIKKKYPDAVMEEDNDGHYTVVFMRTKDHKRAMDELHKIYGMGLWCGIEEIN